MKTSAERLSVALGVAFFAVLLIPSSASADFLSVWARGHGSYINGDPKLRYFSENAAGPGYGFGLGGEVFQVDVLLDANFHPRGSTFNQLGLGFDIDVVPIDAVAVEPTAQALYFFGGHEDDADPDKGLHFRGGVQAAVKLFKFTYLGAEGFAGYVLTTPELAGGVVYSGSLFLKIEISVL